MQTGIGCTGITLLILYTIYLSIKRALLRRFSKKPLKDPDLNTAEIIEKYGVPVSFIICLIIAACVLVGVIATIRAAS